MYQELKKRVPQSSPNLRPIADRPTHIAQNIAETCQKYFQSFIAIEILLQHFCQLFQNISLQHYNFNFLKYFCK